MKGILLAGGIGSRLYPITSVLSKQLLPVYDKPMVYYPLSLLMLANVRDVLIVSDPFSLPLYKATLRDGSYFGMRLSYAAQEEPRGIAESLAIGESFLGGESSMLVLGDNVMWGAGLSSELRRPFSGGCRVFGYRVGDPSRYGVAMTDPTGRLTAVVEKPRLPASDLAVPGVYFFNPSAPLVARSLRPSARGEIEIAGVINTYCESGSAELVRLGRGVAWLDAGTPSSLVDAANFVRTVEDRQGLKIACLEEIAYRQGWISRGELLARAAALSASDYGRYLSEIADEEI
jgi:glucose-1-phosphate thymidylyltransferase